MTDKHEIHGTAKISKNIKTKSKKKKQILFLWFKLASNDILITENIKIFKKNFWAVEGQPMFN